MGVTHKIAPCVLECKGGATVNELRLLLGAEFHDHESLEFLRTYLLSGNGCWIFLEYPYVDKDFRSVYYNFHARRGLRTRTFCVRLHLFSAKVTYQGGVLYPDAFPDDAHHPDALQNIYLGFTILRPTYYRTIGKTVIKPSAVVDGSGYCLTAKYTVHLCGKKLEIDGFPFMTQHTDASVCAHVVCWSILRYFSQAFIFYQQKLINDIREMAAPLSQGGLIPSRGLTVEQAVRIFSMSGLYPDVYNKDDIESPLCQCERDTAPIIV